MTSSLRIDRARPTPDGTPFPISENLPDHLRRVVRARLSDVHDALEENIGTFLEHTFVNDTGLAGQARTSGAVRPT